MKKIEVKEFIIPNSRTKKDLGPLIYNAGIEKQMLENQKNLFEVNLYNKLKKALEENGLFFEDAESLVLWVDDNVVNYVVEGFPNLNNLVVKTESNMKYLFSYENP